MKAPQGWLFYDGECSLCVAMARRFGRWLRRRGIEVRPLQASGVPERLALGMADLLKEMRFLTKAGDVFGGAEAVVRIARQTGWGWPLFALSRLPGARPLLSGGYRWIARRRKCGAGACGRGQPQPWLDWLPLAVFPFLVLQPALPAWGFMWAMAFAIFFGCKWLTWRKACEAGAQPNLWRSLTYLLAWPGMDAGEFLGVAGGRDGRVIRSPVPGPRGQSFPRFYPEGRVEPCLIEWSQATLKILFGAALLWGVVRRVQSSLLAAWLGLLGLVFLLHFGLFHFLALVLRRIGINARPIMRAPILATSLADFWGRRWNAAFHKLAHTFAFLPLRRSIGTGGATLAVFFISGLFHEAVISLPAGGGYGLPTVYFLIQGLGLLFERTKTGRRLGLGFGLRGWIFTAACTVGPAVWLFHPLFINNVILPFLRVIGAF